MARCEATTEAGERCQTHALLNERYCIFHSKSEKAGKYRRVSRPKHSATRAELLRELTHDLRNVKSLEVSNFEKIKIRSRLASQISNLLDSLDEIGELRKLAEKIKNET